MHEVPGNKGCSDRTQREEEKCECAFLKAKILQPDEPNEAAAGSRFLVVAPTERMKPRSEH